jgi:hypothetical protein
LNGFKRRSRLASTLASPAAGCSTLAADRLNGHEKPVV